MSSGPVGRSAILETEVNRLIRTVTEELGTRGLTTPFLFSSLGTVLIDIISARVRRIIQAFLRTCVSYPVPDAEYTWREEARFAMPPELTMCLRWGLAHILRVSGCHAVHRFIPWDMYVGWSSELCKQFFSHSRLPVILTLYSPRIFCDPF